VTSSLAVLMLRYR